VGGTFPTACWFGVLLWLIYGLLLHAEAVILANFATAILIGMATVLKAWTANRDQIREDVGRATVDRGCIRRPLRRFLVEDKRPTHRQPNLATGGALPDWSQ
jgi:hypothetical protein